MQNQLVLILAVVLVLALGLLLWLNARKRRSQELRQRFGPEYDRAVTEHADRGRAEAALEERRQRVERLHIRPLSADEQDQFAGRWRSVQAQFVDDPGGAVREADRLVGELMGARGYPVGDFEQRAADVSVDHPRLVDDYRAAHRIAGKNEHGEADTESLRTAMVHFRALFEDLLETTQTTQREVRS